MKTKRFISMLLAIILLFVSMNLPIQATIGESSNSQQNQVTVHFLNSDGWQTPYIYYYGGATSSAWPGEKMTNDGGNWYSYTIPNCSQVQVLFNNNSGSQIPGNGQEGFLITGEKWYINGTWYDNAPTKTTVHYYNSNNWSTPYLYYYTSSGTGTTPAWPGGKMTAEGGGWYKYTIYSYEQVRVMFNNNSGSQSPESGQQGLLVTGEKWYLNGSWYDKEPPSLQIHFYNYDNWSNVNIYYYYGSHTGKSWPGNAMSADGDGWYTFKIYDFEQVKVLFNNGSGAQIPASGGFDASEEMWYRNGVWTNQKPKEIKIHFRKPDSWKAPNIYYYLDSNDKGPDWPGSAMKEEGNGWYVFTITKYAQAKVIFNDGTSQIPEANQSGFQVNGEMWYENGRWIDNPTPTFTPTVVPTLTPSPEPSPEPTPEPSEEPSEDTAEYKYDKLGRLIKITYDEENYVEYKYDQNGNITDVNVVHP